LAIKTPNSRPRYVRDFFPRFSQLAAGDRQEAVSHPRRFV
jgi:hypothetical protein